MADLPTNFKDDILDTSVNTRRRYRMYENTDGTIELEDVTEYSQVGDEFGAGQINATNREVNKRFDKNMIVRDLNTINAITKEGYVPDALALKEVNDSLGGVSQFIVDETTGKITGYKTEIGGADTVFPFSSGNVYVNTFTSINGTVTISGIPFKPEAIIVCSSRNSYFESVYYYDANNVLVKQGFWSGYGNSFGVATLTNDGFTYCYDSTSTFVYIALASSKSLPLYANSGIWQGISN